MKRSNRLVLLVGVFLAIVAFVGIVILVPGGREGGGKEPTPTAPTTGQVVVAAANIPLSTAIRPDQVKIITLPLNAISPGTFKDPSQVVGRIARQPVVTGAQITTTTLTGENGVVTNIITPPGKRAIAVQVDQVSGVGTVIKTGDYVDLLVGISTDNIPVLNEHNLKVIPPNSEINPTSVKILLQGLQVLGTLLPPAEAGTSQPTPTPAPSASAGTSGGQSASQAGTALNDQQEIVILAVEPNQAEVIKFSQIDGLVSLILRSPLDFLDEQGNPSAPPDVKTDGIILKSLIDKYGVLPQQVITTVYPSPRP